MAPVSRGLWRVVLSSMAGLVIVSSGFWAFASHDASLEHLQRNGLIRVGYAVEAPYAFVADGGEVTGEGPEVAKHVIRELGIRRIRWVQTTFDALIPDLESGRFDVIAAGMFITEARAKRVAFSRATFRVAPGLLVRADSKNPIAACTVLGTHHDAKVAVLAGAVEGPLLRRCGVSRDQLVLAPDAASGRAAVVSGLVTGLALSAPSVRWIVNNDLSTTTAFSSFDMGGQARGNSSRGGFAFRKHDRRLREAWDAVLDRFVGTSAHREMVRRFGMTDEEIAGVAVNREARPR